MAQSRAWVTPRSESRVGHMWVMLESRVGHVAGQVWVMRGSRVGHMGSRGRSRGRRRAPGSTWTTRAHSLLRSARHRSEMLQLSGSTNVL
eukprot:2538438-Rhodomonas_salina.1